MGDQRFMEPNSGLYYQISPAGEPVNLNDVDVLPSRSLWDEALNAGRAFGTVMDAFWMHVGDPDSRDAAENRLRSMSHDAPGPV